MVTRRENRNAILVRYFHRYLNDPAPAQFIADVVQHYGNAALERLAANGGVPERRAAILALTFLGDYRANSIFGKALQDPDRGVRLLADDGIRSIWSRAGNARQRQQLDSTKRLNDVGAFGKSLQLATQMCDEAPQFAEAWNQRGIAQFFLGEFTSSIHSCWRTLSINPFQFEAAVGMGHAYLELDEPHTGLESFRHALQINPSLESIRLHVDRMQKSLEQF